MGDLSQRLTDLSEGKRALLREMLRREGHDFGRVPVRPRAPGQADLPLSYAQESLWFMCHLAGGSAVYNLPSAVRLTGTLDHEAFTRALREIVRRHEILRTRFPAAGGRPTQEILPDLPLDLPIIDCTDLPEPEREPHALRLADDACTRAFDLAEGPLFRARLYRIRPDEHIFLLVFHHLVWDGWSIGVLTGELTALYQAFRAHKPSPLPDLPVQYADYALWQREWLSGDLLAGHLAYWQERLRGIRPMELPLDRPRAATPTFSGAAELIELPPSLRASVDALCQRAGTTLYMTMLAAFLVLLSRYASEDRIVVGTPIANRRRAEIEPLIGHFANIIVVAADLSGRPTFLDLLARVKELTTGAYAHQDLPFEMLVDKLRAPRDAAKNPLFQVMFGLHQERLDTIDLPGLVVRPVNVSADSSHFDLGLHFWRQRDTIAGLLAYNRDLFDAATMKRLTAHYETLLTAAAHDPDRDITTLPYLTSDETAWLSSRTGAPLPPHTRDVLALIAAQARALPSSAAVVAPSGIVTFAELTSRAQRLASHLADTKSPVGLLIEPGPEQVMALVGILQSGCPLVLLDPRASADHLTSILAQAGVTRVVTQRSLACHFPDLDRDRLYVDDPLPDIPSPLPLPAGPEDIAYISHASGRAVSITHRALAERIAILTSRFDVSPGESLWASAPAGRDFFPIEILWPLSRGASIVFTASPCGPSLPDRPIDVAHLTPAALCSILASGTSDPFAGTRLVLASGAPLAAHWIDAHHRRSRAPLVYLYSPPEVAAEVASCVCSLGLSGLPNGEPMGIAIRVRDRTSALVPVGVPGALHAGSVATADRGHWTATGTLAFTGSEPRTLWRDGLRIQLDTIETAILRHPAIDACHTAVRACSGGEDEIVAWVVPAGPIAPRQLEQQISALLPISGLPLTIVPVGTLPFDAEGHLDEQALLDLPIIDEASIQRWEKALSATSARVKVIATKALSPLASIHVSTLLKSAHAATRSAIAPAPPSLQQDITTSHRPALASGGPLVLPEDAPRTLTAALLRTAAAQPDHGVIIVQDRGAPRFLSYGDLLCSARAVLTGLRQAGLREGDRAILQIDDLGRYFTAFWACILGGIAPVTVSTSTAYDRPTAVTGKLFNVWELLGRPAIVASTHLTGALAGVPGLHGASPETAFRVLPVEELERCPPADHIYEARPEDVLFLQLTSGSTGVPKCIQQTHLAVVTHVHASARVNGYDAADVTLNWLPMDHVAPILMCHLKDAYLGAQQIHVKTELVLGDPLLWLDLMAERRVTVTWSPNFGYKLVNDALAQHPNRRWDLSSLRWLLNGGEQVTEPVAAELLRRMAPFGLSPTAMEPVFGMAELCTAVTFARGWTPESGIRRIAKASLGGVLRDADPGEEAVSFVEVGAPAPGIEIRITGPGGEPLAESMIGAVHVRGGTTTPGYLHNEEANREAFAGEGFFDTGDLGFLREGRLTITGRRKEMIIVGGANFYCYEIEDAVSAVPGVLPTFAAACAVDDPTTGTDGLAIFYVPRHPGLDVALLRAVREKVTATFGVSPSHVIPLAQEAFPKTTSGKIQRAQLQRDLVSGVHARLLVDIDLALENERTVPDWFLRPIWQHRTLPNRTLPASLGVPLVIGAEASLGQTLCARLAPEGVLAVETGLGFARLGPNRWSVDPTRYDDLFTALATEGISIDRVFHLASFGPPREDASVGTTDLLAFAQAAARTNKPLRLLAITSHAVARGPEDAIESARAALRGLVPSISQEWPQIECRHIDLPIDDPSAVDLLIREARFATKDREIAYLDGQRAVRRLSLSRPSPKLDLPFSRGDLILVTGGLGGLGIEIARWLLVQHGARLVLVGRSPLDGTATSTDDALAAQQTADERRRAFADLTRLGEVVYEQADVGDRARMAEVVAAAEQRFQAKIVGVFHLAGVFPTRLLADETAESLKDTLHPRLEGSAVLAEVLGDGAFFVGIGTAYSATGGVAVGAYAAGSAVLEAFVDEQRRRGRKHTTYVAFSHWDDVGMSRGYLHGEQSLAQGYLMIGVRRGLASLAAALTSGENRVIAGLDARRPNVQRLLAAPPAPSTKLVAYVDQGTSTAALRDLEIADRFGVRQPCDVVEVPEWPLTEAGEIDVVRLAGLTGAHAAQRERVMPATSLERTIAGIWREVLAVDAIDVNTSFFALGGQSILLIQVLSKLKQATGRDLTVVDLFRHPTIRALAAHLGRAEPARGSTLEKATLRAQKQREAARQRVVPRGRGGERTHK
ncbi:non-ribosomal peptide synthetase/polyketide synthase [Minicystis rosea]|nr:non-ribosomal peptide synthetase/polyketide synthase [Minicystis rosea]